MRGHISREENHFQRTLSGSNATRLRLTATQSEVAATCAAPGLEHAGNLAAGSAFGRTRLDATPRKRAPRRRLPATLPASRHISRGSRLWVAVKRVTQSEVAAMDFALGGSSLGNLVSKARDTVSGHCEPQPPLWSVVRIAVLCVIEAAGYTSRSRLPETTRDYRTAAGKLAKATPRSTDRRRSVRALV